MWSSSAPVSAVWWEVGGQPSVHLKALEVAEIRAETLNPTPSTPGAKASLEKKELALVGVGGFGASTVPQTTIAKI